MNNAIFQYLIRIPVVPYHGPRAYDNNGKEERETIDNEGCRYKESGSKNNDEESGKDRSRNN